MTIERIPDTGTSMLLVADGSLQNAWQPSADPIADWVDLMEAVEVFCPERAERKAVRMGLSGVSG